MDVLQYWAIADRDIEIQNPITADKLDLLTDYCDIRDGLRVLDIGCGKAWLLRRWAETHAIVATGVDVNPAFLDVARAAPPARGRIDYVQSAIEDHAVEAESFDVVLCLGAAAAFGGAPQVLDWMVKATRPGGSVVLGDITLRHKPSLNRGEVLPPDSIGMMQVVERHGTEVSATISASDADFERYASHHRHATLRWARENPDDPAQAAVLKKSREDWTHYQQTIRPMFGWTVFVGRKLG